MFKALTLITAVLLTAAPALAQQIEKSNPPGLSTPAPGTFSHVARSGKLVFIAGQVGTTADGKLVGPGMQEQVEQVFANLQAALKSQGADFTHVVKLTTYVTNIDEYRTPEIGAIRARNVGSSPPPNTLVQIVRLANPAYKVEIEAIAVLP